MYRYLEKYTGTYRVLGCLDLSTNDFPRDENGAIDDSYEDLYIPCSRSKCVIKHTYDDDKLVACFYGKSSAARNVFKEIKDKYKNIDVELEEVGEDGLIYFYDEDIKKVATILRPRTSGASTKWNSNKNLPKREYKIPDADLKQYNDIAKKLDRAQKMQFGKKLIANVLDKNDLREKQKLSRLSAKEYIHSIGKWEELIEAAKEEIKNYG